MSRTEEKKVRTRRGTGKQREMGNIRVRANEKIRQGPRLCPARPTIFLKRFASLKCRIQRQCQTSKSREALFKLLLGVKFDGEFGKDDCIIANRPMIGRLLKLRRGPGKPMGILG